MPAALAAAADETCDPDSLARFQLASTPVNCIAHVPDPDPEPDPEPDPVPSLQYGLPVVGVMHT